VIVPTPRLLLLALFGVIPIGIAPGVLAALLIAALWLILIGALAAVDTRLIPPRQQLRWTREHESKLSLGAWNQISLHLANRSNRDIELQVRDATPAELVPRANAGQGVCPAGGAWDMTYHVFPVHRGDYHLRPVSARYLGPLGFVWRQHSTDLDDSVKVFPNILAVRTYETLLRRGLLEEIGLHSSRRWGTGTEFERLRDYTADDEFRRINWPATARRHRPIAVDYETERSQNIMLVLDAGRLMSLQVQSALTTGSPATELTRLDYAVNAALLLAFVVQRTGDRVGLFAFSDRPLRYAAPRPGRAQFVTLTEALYNLQAESVEADYAGGLGYLAFKESRRSLMVIFTDLAEPEAVSPLVSHAAYLGRKHLVLVVTLRDPGIDRIASLPPDSSRNVYQRAVALTVLDGREEVLRQLRQRGALTLDVSAEQLSTSVINRYLEIKARAGL
jgi:uncharacterized protein (DUF58 family)